MAGLLQKAKDAGLTEPDADARAEAIGLLATSAGLGTSILVGEGPESAFAVLGHHLDRIFRR